MRPLKETARKVLDRAAGPRLVELERQVADLQVAAEESRRLNERLSDVLDVVVELLVPALQRRAHELIDVVAADGRCDFLPAFGDPFPLHAICDVLAIPERARPALVGWADDLGWVFNLGITQYLPRIEAALAGLREGVDELLALRRLTAGAFGTLMALEPGIALVIGFLALHQSPDLLAVAGVVFVVVAGIGAPVRALVVRSRAG